MPSKGWVSIAPYLPQPLRHGTADQDRQQIQAIRRERLCHALASNTVIAFVGSGCSVPLEYPTWDRLTIELGKLAASALARKGQIGEWTPQRFETLRRRIEATEKAEAAGVGSEGLSKPEKYSLLSIAQQILDRPELAKRSGDTPYQAFFRRRFSSRGKRVAPPSSALHALLELPIRRFVTTNYDSEIERSLERRHPRKPVRWFTQELDFIEQLTVFSLAQPEADERVVFHCHGHHARPASIIATERDYQRWYVSEELPEVAAASHLSTALREAESAAFRQTIELLIGSNPILFVGAGLGEDDLLRPVRLLAALEPQHRQASQLFALRPRDPHGAHDLGLEALYERYGIQVIGFDWPARGLKTEDQALARELRRLTDEHSRYLRRAAAKPKVRPVELGGAPPRHYWHYIQSETGDAEPPKRLGRRGVEGVLRRIHDHFEGKAREGAQETVTARASVVVLLGRGGTGKSFHATELLREVVEAEKTEAPRYAGTFFWSSYYADDLLSGVDRLLAFLRLTSEDHHRLEQLASFFGTAERDQRHLVVLDGIERLLVPTEHPEVGSPSNAAVRRFFTTLAKPQRHTDVVITTRLMPDLYLDDGRAGKSRVPNPEAIARIDLQRADWEDLKSLPPFDSRAFPPEQLRRLCSLVEGHTYALSLAASDLSTLASGPARRARLEELCGKLALAPPDRRPGLMIREMIEAAENAAPGGSGRIALELLRRLAAQLSPAGDEVIDLCMRQARLAAGARTELRARRRSHLISLLWNRRLIFRVSSHEGQEERLGWTLHPTVRSFLFESDKNLPGELLPNFTLAGFTSGTGVVHPKSRAVSGALADLFRGLVDDAQKAAREAREAGGARRKSALEARARSLCRSAFSAVRSRMEANTVSRWTSYPRYARFLVELLDLCKELGESELWDRSDPRHLRSIESRHATLHADELAWLYNELGLVFCSEGDMRETYRVWEQGYEINRLIEQGRRPHAQYVVQSLLHLSHTFIELGRLDLAEDYLLETHRANQDFGDHDYRSRILGYRALLAHLQGDFERAGKMYGVALGSLKAAKRNPRAESIFTRFLADLRMHEGKLEEGRQLLDRSRALADAADYPDLVAFCRSSLGRYYRAKRRFPEALREYQAAWGMARKFGIRRLEADVFSEMSRLSLGLGDTAAARLHALRALRLANQLGLGLRQVHGLVVLGLAAVAEKRTELGKAYLRHARDLAFKRRYFLRGYEAQQKLEELGVPPGELLSAEPRAD